MVILDKMIMTGRLLEFVRELLKIRNDEMIDKARWECWLHKVFDMDFSQYLSALDGNATAEERPDDSVLEKTVMDSAGILNGFCPS